MHHFHLSTVKKIKSLQVQIWPLNTFLWIWGWCWVGAGRREEKVKWEIAILDFVAQWDVCQRNSGHRLCCFGLLWECARAFLPTADQLLNPVRYQNHGNGWAGFGAHHASRALREPDQLNILQTTIQNSFYSQQWQEMQMWCIIYTLIKCELLVILVSQRFKSCSAVIDIPGWNRREMENLLVWPHWAWQEHLC